jgi:phosphatidate cytidylyltransferase
MSKELIKRLITSVFIIIITFCFIYLGGFFFNLFLLSIFIISLIEWKNLTNNLLILLLGLIFLLFSIISAYFLRNDNLIYFIFTLLISVSSDLGGYIFGKLFRGPKLTHISPNKTYSGMIGSYLMSIFLGLIFIFYLQQPFILEFYSLSLIIIILIISTVNQLGDLLISYFKRKKKIKDTGKLLPGHGGLLDRIDGIIFSIPISFLIQLIL